MANWNNKQTIQVGGWGWGSGDMTKAVYDVWNTWYVDSAHRILLPFINKIGSTLTKGTIVYLKDSSSSANYPEALKANASTEATSSKTIGAVYEDVADSATGYIVTNWEVNNLDTSWYSVGTSLWLSTTDWQVTTTRPTAPNHAVYIWKVTRSQVSNGRVHYSIMNWYEVNELHDVLFTSLANDDFFQRKWGIWVNRTPVQVKADLWVWITEIEVDFWTIPVNTKKFVITDANINTSSKIVVYQSWNTATDRVGNDWEFDSATFSAKSWTWNFTISVVSNGHIRWKRKLFYSFS